MSSAPPQKSDRLLTVAEVARYLQVSRAGVYRLIRSEGLPSYKVGGQRRFRASAVEQWLAERAS